MSTTVNPQPKIHSYLAHLGFGSRREIETWIEANRIKVNGQTAVIGQRINPDSDEIRVDNKLVKAKTTKLVYFLVNKPAGVVTTTDDELQRENVVDLIGPRPERVYPVGRLDQDSEGLIMLTNDGDFTYQTTHPKFGLRKTYHVQLDRPISEKALEFLKKGTRLADGFTQADEVILLDKKPAGTWLQISLHEGKHHHVRRMVKRAGYEVDRLIRTHFGPFSLEQLCGRPFVELTPEQVQLQLQPVVETPTVDHES